MALGTRGGFVFEYDGRLHTLDPATAGTKRLAITASGDFPWAEPRWEDVTKKISASLSPPGNAC